MVLQLNIFVLTSNQYKKLRGPQFLKTLVADIGGTNSRLAIAITSKKDKQIRLKNILKFKNSDFNNFDEVIKRYLTISDENSINRICVAAAGIISDTTVEMSNLNWKITVPSLQKTTKIDQVFIINDLQAQGYALDFIEPNDLEKLIEGSYSPGPHDTKLVCGMGTGFNVAIAYQTAFGTFVPASEYGHARTTTATEKQKLMIKQLEESSSFISYENISFDSQNHGRENLNIGLDDEMISISGNIQVFEGEFITINLEASLSSGEAKFALNDEDWFIVSWD